MKLQTALSIGKDCGLDTIGEAIVNIEIHATSIFDYGKEKTELLELIDDFNKSGFNRDDKIENFVKEFRVMIAGGRSFGDYKLLERTVDEALEVRDIDKSEYTIIIVSGKAHGADSLGEIYANRRGYEIEPYPAKWDDLEATPCSIKINRHGNPYNVLAGVNRNKDMVTISDLVILFHDGFSKGTQDDVNLVKKYNKDMVYIKY